MREHRVAVLARVHGASAGATSTGPRSWKVPDGQQRIQNVGPVAADLLLGRVALERKLGRAALAAVQPPAGVAAPKAVAGFLLVGRGCDFGAGVQQLRTSVVVLHGLWPPVCCHSSSGMMRSTRVNTRCRIRRQPSGP